MKNTLTTPQAITADPVDADPTSRAQYRRMFNAACEALGAINEALGLDPDDGGAEPILAAIEARRKRLDDANKCVGQWIDAEAKLRTTLGVENAALKMELAAAKEQLANRTRQVELDTAMFARGPLRGTRC